MMENMSLGWDRKHSEEWKRALKKVKVSFLSDGNIHFFNCDGEFIDRNIYIYIHTHTHLKYVQSNVNEIDFFSE